MKIVKYYKTHYPATSLYFKTMRRIARNMTDVMVTTFVKDKLHILKEKDVIRMEPLIEETDRLFEFMETLQPLVDYEADRAREYLKKYKQSKKKNS